MKPPGLAFTLAGGMRVTQPTSTEDAVWEAVEEAMLAGWTVERFRQECAEAWKHAQREQIKSDQAAWRKP